MKDLITAIASLLLLLALILQFATGLAMHNQMIRADRALDNFRDLVKVEGCISEENRTSLAQTLGEITNGDIREIYIDGETTVKERGERIYYKVSYSLNHVIGAPLFFGISEEENRLTVTEESYVISRRMAEPEQDAMQTEQEEQTGGNA